MNATVRFWLGCGVVIALLWALVAWSLAQWNLNNYTRLVADRLLLLAELRRGALQEYFSTAEAELRFWSTNERIISAQGTLLDIWNGESGDAVAARVRADYFDNNPSPEGFRLDFDGVENGNAYDDLHLAMHPETRLFVTERGYYDFFLIGPDGDVYYTVEKEADLAVNLERGALRNTGLAEVYRRAKRERREGTIAISDMQSYAPSGAAAAIFMATALHDQDGRFIGVIAFQLPTDRILGIMAYTSGMGETGETYLVGEDQLMRSDSRFSEASTLLLQRVDTETVELALAGQQGAQVVTDYRNVAVMSAYLPLELGDTRWAVMAEIDRDEIETGAARERPAMSGLLALFYGLSLWSAWYWRGRPEHEEKIQMDDLAFADMEGGALGD